MLLERRFNDVDDGVTKQLDGEAPDEKVATHGRAAVNDGRVRRRASLQMLCVEIMVVKGRMGKEEGMKDEDESAVGGRAA